MIYFKLLHMAAIVIFENVQPISQLPYDHDHDGLLLNEYTNIQYQHSVKHLIMFAFSLVTHLLDLLL